MKLAILLVLGLFVPTISADESSHEEKILQLMETLQVKKQVQSVTKEMHGIFVNQIKSMEMPPEYEPQFLEYQKNIFDLVEEYIGWETQRGLYLEIYRKTLNEEDVDNLLSFFDTPTGRKFLQGQESMSLIIKMHTQDHMQELRQRLMGLSIQFSESLKTTDSTEQTN